MARPADARCTDAIAWARGLTLPNRLKAWLTVLVDDHRKMMLPFDLGAAQIRGRLRVPYPENSLDEQVAATASCTTWLSSPATLATSPTPGCAG